MNLTVACIVEGQGDVKAVPVLLRRIVEQIAPDVTVSVLPPLRVQRSKLVRAGELERAITLASKRLPRDGAILILVDADDDLACELAPALLERAQQARGDMIVSTVLAVREYEAWFLAAAQSLRSRRGLRSDLEAPADPEAIRDAKRWLDQRMMPGATYSPAVDQAALTAVFDLAAARATRSFSKLWRELERWLAELRASGANG